jgi:Na+/melibiose symporter-like transporter
MMISGAASLVCAVLPGMIIKGIGGEVNGAAQVNGYLIMAAVLGLVFGLAWLIVFLGVKEKKDLETPEKVTFKDWLGIFKNKPYRNYLGIFLTFQIAVDLVLAIFIFYVDLVILKYQYYELFVGLLLVFQIIFMVVNNIIAQKKGKTFPLFIGLPIWIAVSIGFLAFNNTTPIWVIAIMAVLIALGSSAGNLSTWSMLTDIYDIDEIKTAKRREGLYSGVTTFARKFGSGLAILILGIGLKTLGFDQDTYNMLRSTAENFDPSVFASSSLVAGIRWMFVAIPAFLCLLCLVFAFFNKINKRRFDAVIAGIESFKLHGNLDSLSPEVIRDIEVATGVKKEALWAGKIKS